MYISSNRKSDQIFWICCSAPRSTSLQAWFLGTGWAAPRRHRSLPHTPWASPRVETGPCGALTASYWTYSVFQDWEFPRHKFKFLAKRFVLLYYNERCTVTFSWDIAYCSQVVPLLVEGKSWAQQSFVSFRGSGGDVSQRFYPWQLLLSF